MPEYRSAIGAMVCAVGLVCFAQTVRAQSKPGKITGVVTDPAGAVVPNARVTISGPDGFSEEAPSDAQGRFAAAGLVPGEYRLQAAADGFVSYQSAGLRIRAGDTLSGRRSGAPSCLGR
jgi:Carboxypeptidase regulatory-like domain